MIKLVAIDLDGTLFTPKQQITKTSRNAVRRLIDKGIQPIIVTGREQSGVEAAIDMLGLDLPYICSAGALIRSGKQGEVISARTFHNHDETKAIIRFAREKDAGLIADASEGNFWFGADDLFGQLDPLTNLYAQTCQRTFTPERDFDHPILKISIVGENEQLMAMEKEITANCSSVRCTYAGMNYLDVTRRDVNKGTALEIYAAQTGIAPADIAAIGDQPIDISMLRFSGLPIAMGNAPESVKQAAQWIAPNNNAEGVTWAIERIIKEAL